MMGKENCCKKHKSYNKSCTAIVQKCKPPCNYRCKMNLLLQNCAKKLNKPGLWLTLLMLVNKKVEKWC